MMASLINVAKVLMVECWKIFKDDFDKQSMYLHEFSSSQSVMGMGISI